MWYGEKIVNGVLCHRDLFSGQWIPFNAEELTIAYTALTNSAKETAISINKLENTIIKIQDVIGEEGWG